MSAIAFPSSPYLYQVFTSGSRQWQWDGSVWNAITSASPYFGNGAIYSITAPLTASPGQQWVDTNTLLTFVWYSSAWVEVENVGLSLPTVGIAQMPSGSVIQTQVFTNTQVVNLSVAIPVDDTIPQSTEGISVLSGSITPFLSSSKILITVGAMVTRSSGSAGNTVGAIFRSSGADAIFASGVYTGSDGVNVDVSQLFLTFTDSPSSSAAVPYSIRMGPSGAGGTGHSLNGPYGGRFFGGVSVAYMNLQEIKA